MPRMKEAASEFLAKKRVAVTGVSRQVGGHGGNVVYQRLRDRGYEVFAVNPNADEVEGDPCYHDLRSIPGGVEAVVIATRPEHADETMRECAELGIRHVWMHRGPGAGSVSETAAGYGREQGDRTYRIYEKTVDDTFRITADSTGNQYFTVRAKYEFSSRTGSGFEEHLLEEVGEQPETRHFDIANRDRTRASVILTVIPVSYLSINGSVGTGKDDASDSLDRRVEFKVIGC